MNQKQPKMRNYIIIDFAGCLAKPLKKSQHTKSSGDLGKHEISEIGVKKCFRCYWDITKTVQIFFRLPRFSSFLVLN